MDDARAERAERALAAISRYHHKFVHEGSGHGDYDTCTAGTCQMARDTLSGAPGDHPDPVIIETIALLRLEAGDVLVVRPQQRLSQHEQVVLADRMKPLLPPGVRVLILDREASLTILRARAGVADA